MAKKSDKSDNHFFVNSIGMKVPVVPVSMLEIEAMEQNIKSRYIADGEPIDPPTYEVEVVGGGKTKHPLTPNNLLVEGDEEESLRRKMDWLTHQNALARMQAEINRVRTEMMLEGIDVQIPEDGKWLARCKRMGIPLPEDPEELLTYYKKSQVIRTPEDLLDIELLIMESSTGTKIAPEKVAAVKAKFRSTVYEAIEGTGELDNTDGSSEGTA